MSQFERNAYYATSDLINQGLEQFQYSHQSKKVSSQVWLKYLCTAMEKKKQNKNKNKPGKNL